MSQPLPRPPRDPDEEQGCARRGFACGCIGCGGLCFFAGIALVLVSAVPNPVALGIATVAAVLPVPMYIFLILQLDRYEREPWLAMAAAFLWGALVATFLAAIFNDLVGMTIAASLGPELGNTLTTAAVAPIVEEAAKGVAVLLLYFILRHEFDNVLDGIVYGSLVGIGFAMTENILYFGRFYLQEGIIGVGFLFYIRVILGGFGHALYTGTTGAAIGLARESHSRWVGAVLIPLGYFLAVVQHAAWNFIGATLVPELVADDIDPIVLLFVVMPITTFVLTAPGLIALIVTAVLAWSREASVIRVHLRDEVDRGTLTPEEYDRLSSQRRRTGLEFQALRQRNPHVFFALRDFHQAATELAFRKWHLARGEAPKRAQRRTPEDRYRDQIAAIRTRLS